MTLDLRMASVTLVTGARKGVLDQLPGVRRRGSTWAGEGVAWTG